MADGIPVVGHAKGLIHYACGDEEGGDRAMRSCTRSSGVIAGGVAGFFMGGPVGAVGGGIAAGVSMDSIATAVTDRPSGYIAAVEAVQKNPSPGGIFDLVAMPVFDGMAGYSAGQSFNEIVHAGKFDEQQFSKLNNIYVIL